MQHNMSTLADIEWASDTKPRMTNLYTSSKRLFDVVLAVTGLLLLAPVIAVLGLLIKLESSGPVFFSQSRCGLKGAPFRFWKFRSMVVDAEARKTELMQETKGDLRFKMVDDPRITWIGKFIRKYSIDELPQLWNVLIGDMSLVGPRPPLPDEVAQYSAHAWHRLDVIPGITCTWQIGGRSQIPFPEQVELDLSYIRTRSLRNDFVILLRTSVAVLAARGAC
ncbi:MAG: lipopolysaccharide/colanic/teichoic acid biosynthesis glycosyltransferase [Candidatus Azotimanducaceae bacterium]|jgi:lipopolysaccharide/colanic/teichoic acid biosynthesis glycosyltransferase